MTAKETNKNPSLEHSVSNFISCLYFLFLNFFFPSNHDEIDHYTVQLSLILQYNHFQQFGCMTLRIFPSVARQNLQTNKFLFKYKSTRRVSQIRRFIQQVCISYHIFSNKLMKTVVIKFHHMQNSLKMI